MEERINLRTFYKNQGTAYKEYCMYPPLSLYQVQYYKEEHTNFIMNIPVIGSVLVSIIVGKNPRGVVQSILGVREYFFFKSHMGGEKIAKYKMLKYIWQAYVFEMAEDDTTGISDTTEMTVHQRQSSNDGSLINLISTLFISEKKPKKPTSAFSAASSCTSTVSSGTRTKDFKRSLFKNKQKFLNYFTLFLEVPKDEADTIYQIYKNSIDFQDVMKIYIDQSVFVEDNPYTKEVYQLIGQKFKKKEFFIVRNSKPNMLSVFTHQFKKNDPIRRYNILEEFFITEFNYYKQLNSFYVKNLIPIIEMEQSSSDPNGVKKNTIMNSIFGSFIEVLQTEKKILSGMVSTLGYFSIDLMKEKMTENEEKIIIEMIKIRFEHIKNEMEKQGDSSAENLKKISPIDMVIYGVCNVFLLNLKYMQSYKQFCTTYSYSLDLLKQNKKEPYIRKNLPKENLSVFVESFFILPIQRIIRYKMYLESIASFMPPELVTENMKDTIMSIIEFIQVINDERDRYEMGRLSFCILEKVNHCPASVVNKNRGFIKELVTIDVNGYPGLSIFLYTDIVMVASRNGVSESVFNDIVGVTYEFIKTCKLKNINIISKGNGLLKISIYEELSEKEFTKVPTSIVTRSEYMVLESFFVYASGNYNDFLNLFSDARTNSEFLNENNEVYKLNNSNFYFYTDIDFKVRGSKEKIRKRDMLFFEKRHQRAISVAFLGKSEEKLGEEEKIEKTGITYRDIPNNFRELGTSEMKNKLSKYLSMNSTTDNKSPWIQVLIFYGDTVKIKFNTNIIPEIEPIVLDQEEFKMEFYKILNDATTLCYILQPIYIEKLEEISGYFEGFYLDNHKRFKKMTFSGIVPLMDKQIKRLSKEIAEEIWSRKPEDKKKVEEEIQGFTLDHIYQSILELELRAYIATEKHDHLDWVTKFKMIVHYFITNTYNMFTYEDLMFIYYTGTTEFFSSLKLSPEKTELIFSFLRSMNRFYYVFDIKTVSKVFSFLFCELPEDPEWLENWTKVILNEYGAEEEEI